MRSFAKVRRCDYLGTSKDSVWKCVVRSSHEKIVFLYIEECSHQIMSQITNSRPERRSEVLQAEFTELFFVDCFDGVAHLDHYRARQVVGATVPEDQFEVSN